MGRVKAEGKGRDGGGEKRERKRASEGDRTGRVKEWQGERGVGRGR